MLNKIDDFLQMYCPEYDPQASSGNTSVAARLDLGAEIQVKLKHTLAFLDNEAPNLNFEGQHGPIKILPVTLFRFMTFQHKNYSGEKRWLHIGDFDGTCQDCGDVFVDTSNPELPVIQEDYEVPSYPLASSLDHWVAKTIYQNIIVPRLNHQTSFQIELNCTADIISKVRKEVELLLFPLDYKKYVFAESDLECFYGNYENMFFIECITPYSETPGKDFKFEMVGFDKKNIEEMLKRIREKVTALSK